MEITVKLFAHLARYLPPDARANEAKLALPAGATVAQVLARLRVPASECHLVLVDGAYVTPAERPSRLLAAGSVLAVWPLVAGG